MVLSALFILTPSIEEPTRDAYLKAFKTPAPAVVAIITECDQVVWEGNRGAKSDSPFRIASLTKAFTATVILQMVAEGKLALDEPVATYLPQLPAAWKEVTVRHLLNHTSGIPSYTSQADFVKRIEEPVTPADIIARTEKLPLDFAPGKSFAYNNSGYVILGVLAEKIDGKPIADILKSRIFTPLKLTKTYLDTNKKAESLGFDANGKPALAISMTQPYAAGSIVSTGADMAKWVANQGSSKLIPDAIRNKIREPFPLTDGKPSAYSAGWQIGEINKVRFLLHTGGIPGFSTVAIYVPGKKVGVVVLTNSEGGNPSALAMKLAESAVPEHKQTFPTVPDPDPRVTGAVKDALYLFSFGTPDLTQFTKDLAGALTPNTISSFQTFLKQAGDVKELKLIKVEGSVRTYRVECVNGAVRLLVSQDETRKFSLWQMGSF